MSNENSSEKSSSSGGEVGDTVLYRCTGLHSGAPVGRCAGDIHPAIVLNVLARDSSGAPLWLRLAMFSPGQPHSNVTVATPKLEQLESKQGTAMGEWRPRGE